MKNYFLIFSAIVLFFYSSCQFSSSHEKIEDENKVNSRENVKRDTALLYLDSLRINEIVQQYFVNGNYKQDIGLFYLKRNFAFAWINKAGINEYGNNFLNLLNHEEQLLHNDCTLFPDSLKALYNKVGEEGYKTNSDDESVAALEILLTVNFFDYARRNWSGASDDELKSVGWFIERPKLNYEALLDTILESEPNKISSYEPVYRQYGLLKKYLQKYNGIDKEGGWGKWSIPPGKHLREGDTSSIITPIKKQLFLMGDLAVADTTILFNSTMEVAVKKFERRHGLKEDGMISGNTLAALQVPLHERIQQLLINMERCRWVPAEQKGDYLVVNIPAFKLFVYHDDSLEWSCNVIVGKSRVTNNTVIFNDNLEYIVFSPYWNIPQTILIKETLPEIKKDPGYLLKHHMEVVDESGHKITASSINWKNYSSHFPFIIRQQPGKNNSLGLVKFLFPNSYDIYMHDTPEKSLFGETTRTFSHGCIRLEEPYKLAAYLLRGDSAWNENKINEMLYGGKQTFVKLKSEVPVFIAYFTAWVDRGGNLNFRDDIYHHDAKMKRLLFSEFN